MTRLLADYEVRLEEIRREVGALGRRRRIAATEAARWAEEVERQEATIAKLDQALSAARAQREEALERSAAAERERKRLDGCLEPLRQERDALIRRRDDPPNGRPRGRFSGDVVPTESLAAILHGWAADYGYGAWTMLSLRSRVRHRTIYRVRHRGSTYTNLDVADALLLAVGRPDALGRDVPVIGKEQVARELGEAVRRAVERRKATAR